MSGASSRRKGSSFEQQIRRYLRDRGYEVVNPAATGFGGGDVELPEILVSLECKNHRRLDLPAWWRQAETQRPDRWTTAVVHKRHSVAGSPEQWVTMTLNEFLDLVERMSNELQILGEHDLHEIDDLCKVMHTAYEIAAVQYGWDTNPRSAVDWEDVPPANKATMRFAVEALLRRLARKPT